MQKIGVIAKKSEREQTRPWWKFWQREEDYEEIEFKELNFSAIIVYIPDKNYLKYVSQATEFFRAYGVYHCLKTTDEDAAELERALLPRKLKYLTRKFGRDTRDCGVVYQWEEMDGLETSILLEVARMCKSVCIVTNKTTAAERISERIFTELGLVAEVTSEMPLHTSRFDYLLKTNGEIQTLSEEKTYKFSIYCENLPVLPVKVDSLPLLKTLWKSGIISLEDIKI